MPTLWYYKHTCLFIVGWCDSITVINAAWESRKSSSSVAFTANINLHLENERCANTFHFGMRQRWSSGQQSKRTLWTLLPMFAYAIKLYNLLPCHVRWPSDWIRECQANCHYFASWHTQGSHSLIKIHRSDNKWLSQIIPSVSWHCACSWNSWRWQHLIILFGTQRLLPN